MPDIKVYLITDRTIFCDSEKLLAAVGHALEAGVKAVQLREKDLGTRDLLELAGRFRELTIRHGAALFVNDRLDIALAVGADGLHLGQTGIPVEVARKIAGDKLKIGCSTHSFEEADEAEKQGADYITFGPVFETASKMMYGKPLGLDALRGVCGKIKIPVFGIGGIKKDNVSGVLNSGAAGVALISGILAESDRAAAASEYLKRTGE